MEYGMDYYWRINDMVKIQEVQSSKHIILALLGLLTFSGCTTFEPKVENMIPENISKVNRLGQTACINMSGEGVLDSAEWMATGISFRPTMFANAIDRSLIEAGLFDRITDCDANSQYQLDVFIVHVEGKPGVTRFSSSYGVVVAHWKLIKKANEEILLDQEITGRYEIRGSGDAARALRAVEGAASDNIKQGLEYISKLVE